MPKRVFQSLQTLNLELGGGNKVLFKSATQATPTFSKLLHFTNVTRNQFNKNKYFCPGRLLNNSNFLLNRGVTTCETGTFLYGKISNYLTNIMWNNIRKNPTILDSFQDINCNAKNITKRKKN